MPADGAIRPTPDPWHDNAVRCDVGAKARSRRRPRLAREGMPSYRFGYFSMTVTLCWSTLLAGSTIYVVRIRPEHRARSHGPTSLPLIVMTAVGLLLVGAVSMTLSDYQAGVHLLRWIREHWLNAVAITAMATIAAACVPVLLAYKERRRVEQVPTEQAHGGHQLRELMLHRVRSNWISGVLGPSLGNVFQLNIGLQLRPDLVLPAHNLRERLSGPIPGGKGIFDVFSNDADRLMLIIGDPGAGKTTLMLQLAEQLLAAAEGDSDSPIPVVANLASWSPLCKPLMAWLSDELFESYHVPREIAEEWIENDSLALFLDGFDEVAHARQGDCAAAINDYIRYHGFVPIVVCSRRAAIEKVSPLLGLETAVELIPPSDAQIDKCLDLLYRDGAPVGDIQSALRADGCIFLTGIDMPSFRVETACAGRV